MALRAVSIVSLENSVRSQFDRRLETIMRDIRRQSDSRQQSAEDDGADSNTNHEIQAPVAEEVDPPPAFDRQSQDNAEAECQTIPNIRTSDSNDAISVTIDNEIEQLSETDRGSVGCCQFYRTHWLGHFVSGIVTGFLFVLLGVIFIINGESFPFYAGLTLLILGLAPCCMAINRYRYARLYDRERRRAVNRLTRLRRMHRENRRNQQRQQYPDLPPSYDNLGFDLSDENFQIIIDQQSINGGSSTRSQSFVLPTYDQCVKKESTSQDKEPNDEYEISGETSRESDRSIRTSSEAAEDDIRVFAIEIPGYYAGSTRDVGVEANVDSIPPSSGDPEPVNRPQEQGDIAIEEVQESDLQTNEETAPRPPEVPDDANSSRNSSRSETRVDSVEDNNVVENP